MKTATTVAYEIFRELRREAAGYREPTLVINAHPDAPAAYPEINNATRLLRAADVGMLNRWTGYEFGQGLAVESSHQHRLHALVSISTEPHGPSSSACAVPLIA